MSAVEEPEFDVAEAYEAKGPDENRELYRRWADTYESGFITNRGYVYHERVAALFVDRGGSGPVLDVGCGTGIVGEALATHGISPIDGIDISPDMMAKAAEKTHDGVGVYRSFVEADLTKAIDVPSRAYTAVISVGTFTIGHVGPEAFAELFRVGAPGARYCFGINRAHFADRGFEAHLDEAVAAGTIGAYDLTEIRMYEVDGTDEHSADTALVAQFMRS